jgi:hypothetical protein
MCRAHKSRPREVSKPCFGGVFYILAGTIAESKLIAVMRSEPTVASMLRTEERLSGFRG